MLNFKLIINCLIYYVLFLSLCINGISTNDEKTKPHIIIHPQSFTVTIGHSPTLQLGVEGTRPYTYQWQKNRNNILLGTDSIYTVPPMNFDDSAATFRCIVSNSIGCDTSMEAKFEVIPDTVIDIDGNAYKIITIGVQIWFAENLRTTKFCDGSLIPNVSVDSSWKKLATPGMCWYKNDSIFKESFGGYYNGYAVETAKLAPTGWHVSTNYDWDTLLAYLGGESVAGAKLKEVGFEHWDSTNADATNETGFTALGGGYREKNYGYFWDFGKNGNWWTSSKFGTLSLYYRSMWARAGSVSNSTFTYRKGYGLNIRCVRN